MKKNFTKIKRGVLAAALALGFTGAASAQTLFSESFTGTSIPTGWTNTNTPGTIAFIRETDGVSNGAFSRTFNGPTFADGYVLYDSDDNAYASDNAELTTPAINTTGKSVVFLKFNELYTHYAPPAPSTGSSSAVVSVSTNGTTWTDVHSSHTGLASNASTSNPRLANVDISTIAANQPTVYVRFKYTNTVTGGAYQWFLDDIEVYSPTAGTSDLAVGPIYTLGKLPLTGNSGPHVVRAVIRNAGANLVASETVTLTVSGATTFTATATVTNLAAGASTTVSFPGFTPTAAGTNTITVTVPADLVPTNNTATETQLVTANTISVATGNPPTGTSVTGFGGTNAFYVRYNTNNTASTNIPNVRAAIGSAGPPNGSTVGQTLYAVVLDANGVLLARSANKVITAAEVGTLVDFPILTPPTLGPNAVFHAGLVQVGGPYFPLITQPESPARPLTYFTGPAIGGTLTPSSSTTTRFVIEADIVAAPASLTDASVEAVYSLGKVSLTPGGNQSPVQAVIKNTGTNALTNVVVTATISTSTYNQSVTIPSLAAGQTITVNFPAYTAASPANTKNLTVTLTATGDANAANNTMTTPIMVTPATNSYANTETPDSYVGFSATNSNAGFLIKLNATGSIRVNVVRAFIRDNAASIVGKTVFAVVVDSSGNEVGRSANVVLASGDLGSMRPFAITQGNPNLTNTAYYVGLIQATYTGTQYFPLGIQIESPLRAGAYYTWGAGAATPTKPNVSTLGRFLIEADITNITGVKEELNAKLVSVYPNPSNGVFNVSAKDLKGSNLNLVVRDLQGKVVYSAKAAKEGASINLKNLASGIYMLQVSTDSEIAVKRLVIQ